MYFTHQAHFGMIVVQYRLTRYFKEVPTNVCVCVMFGMNILIWDEVKKTSKISPKVLEGPKRIAILQKNCP